MEIGEKITYIRNGAIYKSTVVSSSKSVMGITYYEMATGHWIKEEERAKNVKM